jgi:hypothetical protein
VGEGRSRGIEGERFLCALVGSIEFMVAAALRAASQTNGTLATSEAAPQRDRNDR